MGDKRMTVRRQKIIGVMAPHRLADEQQEAVALQLGELIARLGADLLTGGGGGAMEVVCRAFADVDERSGRVIGIIPAEVSLQRSRYGRKDGYPNPYVEIPIYTHLHQSGPEGLLLRSRNHINVLTSDVVVLLEGGNGTLAEAHLAVRYRRPVIAFLADGHQMAGLGTLPIPKTHRVEEVEAFIRQAPQEGLAPALQLDQSALPSHFRAPDF
jgi:uncharacterized protein (TIGR00725 family)